jgi:polyhydroxybutyrate depolymerase
VPVAYPGARQSIATWNDYDGCRDEGTSQATMLDLEATLSGSDGPAETTVQTFDDGCAAGGHTELWSVMGASHAPTFTAEAPARIVDFLLSRSKP